ncbi:MAG: diguanylate cyclase [Boseongicola sp.]|nr:diguanylate cyclase [Boseongicola sp.]
MANHVLLIDTSTPARILVSSLLKAHHYEVSVCGNIGEASAKTRDLPPDVVIATLRDQEPAALMQDLFDQRIVARGDKAPLVLFLDPVATPERRLDALSAGARDVIATPVADLLLLARLRGVLREAHGLREIERRRSAAASFGFAEATVGFQAASSVALVTNEDATHQGFDRLSEVFGPRFTRLTLDEALAGGSNYVARDIFVLDCSNSSARQMLSALPDLRARDHSRHAAILVMHRDEDCDGAITALTSGASDLVSSHALGDELVHRVQSLVRRKSDADDLRRNSESSMRLAATDPLTGLYNRRYADTYLADVIRNSSVTGEPFAVMMADIDHFKAVNDAHGHAVGDAILREIAKRMTDNLRSIDLVARFGGEEFLVVMPGTDAERAGPAANRLRARICNDPIVLDDGREVTVTVSVGVTVGGAPQTCATGAVAPLIDPTLSQNGVANKLLGLADGALYCAKAAGRNRIEVALTPV